MCLHISCVDEYVADLNRLTIKKALVSIKILLQSLIVELIIKIFFKRKGMLYTSFEFTHIRAYRCKDFFQWLTGILLIACDIASYLIHLPLNLLRGNNQALSINEFFQQYISNQLVQDFLFNSIEGFCICISESFESIS